MDFSFGLALVGAFNFLVAFSLSSLYFKTTKPVWFLKALITYTIINLFFAYLGIIMGSLTEELLIDFSEKAGGVLLLVVGLKCLISAVKTKTMQRSYDITQLFTLIGLIMVVNIDLFLTVIATTLVYPINTIKLFSVLITTTVTAFLFGTLAGKQIKPVFSNMIYILASILLLWIGIHTIITG